jgi:hypothetical protein
MENFFFEVYKIVGILIILSPIFGGAILVSYLLQKGFDKAKKYALFWLLVSIVLSALSIYMLFENEFRYSTFFMFTSWIGVAGAKYSTLKKKSSKKKFVTNQQIIESSKK